MRDQDRYTYDKFMGLWDRGDDDTCPPDHFLDCLNLRFDRNSVEIREGFASEFTAGPPIINRMHIYKPLTGHPHRIVFYRDGNLYDLDYSTTEPLFVAGGDDFSLVSMYGRAYMCFHYRVLNLGFTSNLYVYNGNGPTGFRLAGGNPPTTPLSGVSIGVGNIEQGNLLVSYAFETDSGFITQPYVPPNNQLFVGPNNSITITVPTGPAGTVARRIIAAKTIPLNTYNGDYKSQEFFFVPGNGRIADNTTTTLTLSFFNSELVASADYLFDTQTVIPCGVFLGTYGTRLVIGGGPLTPAVVWFSDASNPEIVSAVSGFVTVDPSEPGGNTNGFEYQGSYVITKRRRSYITSDNGGDPSTWEVDLLDPSVGTDPTGVSVVADASNSWKSVSLVADRSGLMIFDGAFGTTALTDKIKDWWQELYEPLFDRVQVLVDTSNKRIYCLVPRASEANPAPTACNHILVGDYQYGLDPENIIWSPWALVTGTGSTFVKDDISCILLDYDTFPATFTTTGFSLKPRLRLASGARLMIARPDRHYDEIVEGQRAIPSYVRFAFTRFDEDDSFCTLLSIRFRVYGQGDLNVTLTQLGVELDADNPLATIDFLRHLDLSEYAFTLIDMLFNFRANRISTILHQSMNRTTLDVGKYFCLNKVILYGKTTWAALPSLTTMKT